MTLQSFGAARRIFLRRTSVFSATAVFGVTWQDVSAHAVVPGDTLAPMAIMLIDEEVKKHGAVITGPVSLLQRHLSLGYKRAIVLAAALERAHVWKIYHNDAGERCALVVTGHGERSKDRLG